MVLDRAQDRHEAELAAKRANCGSWVEGTTTYTTSWTCNGSPQPDVVTSKAGSAPWAPFYTAHWNAVSAAQASCS